jgi:predicted NACHT family NTPase
VISADEYEAWLDRLGVEEVARLQTEPERVSVTDLLRDAGSAVVLGEPGSGKTTLLRYLALRHAQALYAGESLVSTDLGAAYLPVYVRAGEFSRWAEGDRGLGAFIAEFVIGTMHCPLEPAVVRELIAANLQAGLCLILIDGLDEVSSATERAGVVESIATFASAHLARGSRFVCTSRISGYAAAPLPESFAGVRLLAMNDDAIASFLRGYVPAIERLEAPDKASAIVAQDARQTVAQLLDAFAHSPGVRRLAANPLLLTALLLVQRTHGQLPQRRMDAYKAVADALGHTWRAYHGVPDSELPDERRLTGWLTRLAEWMHAERPEGSATLRDLLQILGPSWAQLNRQTWDPTVLDEADPASTTPAAESWSSSSRSTITAACS